MRNAWPTASFGNVFNDETAGNVKTFQSGYLDSGLYPIVDQGRDLVGGYTNDASSLCKSTPPVIIFGDHTKALKFIDFPFCLGADGTKILRCRSDIDPKYAYHYLRTVQLPDAGYSRHFKFLKELKIPLPPLDEQRRIAVILDQADTIARSRRCANATLGRLPLALFFKSFGNPVGGYIISPTQRLGEIATLISGATPSKSEHRFWDGEIPWVSPKDMKRIEILDTQDHVSDRAFHETNLRQIAAGTPLIVVRGMILAHTVPIAITRRDVAINQDIKAVMFDRALRPEFGMWALRALHPRLLTLVDEAAHGTKRIDSDKLLELSVPTPSLEAQDEFLRAIKGLWGLEEMQRTQLARLDALFASLQHRAFAGELTRPAKRLLETA